MIRVESSKPSFGSPFARFYVITRADFATFSTNQAPSNEPFISYCPPRNCRSSTLSENFCGERFLRSSRKSRIERHSSKPSNCLLTVRIAVFYLAVALFYNEDAKNRRKRKRGNVRSCSSMLGICRISVSHVILSLFWCVFGLYDDFVFLFMTILVQRDLWKIPLHYFITCHYTGKNMSSAAFIGARTGQTSFIIVYVMYYIVI